MQDSRHLPRIHADRERLLARAVNHARYLPLFPHPAGIILRTRSARLSFQRILFCRSSHILNSYENSLLTDVSSWIDWIARPISPAMESTEILPPHSVRAASASGESGIVFVTTTSLMQDFMMFSTAGPESTGCEQHA